jgi:prepilin-type N-terminal cleavage/methylation domain-containing protein
LKNATQKNNPSAASAKGFTIVELMIASAVFSTVLLVALTGFLQIGRLFYKGVSETQTQDTTRQVVSDISSNLKATSSTVAIPQTFAGAGQPYSYFCAGAYRYTYGTYMTGADSGHTTQFVSSLASIYDPSAANVNMGLVKDRVGSGNCPQPCANGSTNAATRCTGTRVAISGATELLGNGMRIGQISINQVGTTSLYNVNVSVVYGDYSVLDYNTTPPTCAGNSSEQRFCAVDQLSTSVFEGELHP